MTRYTPVLVGIFIGMIVIITGLMLTSTVVAFAITAATSTGIGSFAGVSSIIGIVPILWVFLVIILSLAIVAYSVKLAGGTGS